MWWKWQRALSRMQKEGQHQAIWKKCRAFSSPRYQKLLWGNFFMLQRIFALLCQGEELRYMFLYILNIYLGSFPWYSTKRVRHHLVYLNSAACCDLAVFTAPASVTPPLCLLPIGSFTCTPPWVLWVTTARIVLWLNKCPWSP